MHLITSLAALSAICGIVAAIPAPQAPSTTAPTITSAPSLTTSASKTGEAVFAGLGCGLQSVSGYDPATWCECFPGGNALTNFPTISGICPYGGPSPFPSGPGITPTATTTSPTPTGTACSIVTTTYPSSIAAAAQLSQGPYTMCTCQNGEMAGLNLAVSGKTSTTYCATGSAAPSGYTQVPYGPGAPAWAANLDPPAPCSDPSKGTDSSCWKTLDLTDYVNWWWATNNGTCGQLTFADCYYASAITDYSPSGCSEINSNVECKQPTWSDWQPMWNSQRAFYVAWTIWNLNGLFANYYNAISKGQSIVSSELDNIISIINPVNPQSTAWNDIMTALSVGLAFIPDFSEVAVGSEALVKGLIVAAQQAPTVAKYVWPTGTSDSQQVDVTKIGASLGDIITQFEKNYQSALSAAAGDVGNFIAFAANTPISGSVPNLENVLEQCLTTLYTFVISQAYQADNVIITRQVATDVNALCKNGTDLNWLPGCGNGYGQYGECATFWWDSTADISYALTDTQNQLRDFNSDMQTFFNNYTSGALLLGGADACAQASHSTQGKNPIFDTSPGGSSTLCLSNINVCTWDLTAKNQQPNPFTDCPSNTAPKFYSQACEGATGDFAGGAAPIQYLGWGLLNNQNYKNAEEEFCMAFN